MNDNELNAQVARLVDSHMEYRPRMDTPYATDVGAAMQACLTLEWLPMIDIHSANNIKVNVIPVTKAARRPSDRVISIRNKESERLTEAIARALCEALVEAEGE